MEIFSLLNLGPEKCSSKTIVVHLNDFLLVIPLSLLG